MSVRILNACGWRRGVKKFQLIGKIVQCKNQVAQITRAYTIMWLLVIIYKHLEIYSKTISRLRLGDYKPIFTLPSASRHLAFGNYVPKIHE